MLEVIETRFATAIKKAVTLSKDLELGTGPSSMLPPEKQMMNFISVWGMNMTPAPVPDEEALLRARSPAYVLTMHKLPTTGVTDGINKDFVLPAVASSTVLTEVEAPSGCAVRLGEDYEVSEKPGTTAGQVIRTIQFYQAPATGSQVVATVRGELRTGYVERRLCQVKLVISVWAALKTSSATPIEVDVLGRTVLGAALGVTVDMPDFEASMPTDTRQRLMAPWAVLSSVDRVRETVANAPFLFNRVNFTFTIRGEIELTFVGAKPAPRMQINEIQGTIERLGIPGESLAQPRTKDKFTRKK